MTARICTVFTAVWGSMLLMPVQQTGQQRDRIEVMADSIRATDAEMRFNTIPWVLDLFEGMRLAEIENRPLFLYTVMGDPLGDC